MREFMGEGHHPLRILPQARNEEKKEECQKAVCFKIVIADARQGTCLHLECLDNYGHSYDQNCRQKDAVQDIGHFAKNSFEPFLFHVIHKYPFF